MNQEKGLGLRLQKARRKANLTQQQLCQKSGLSYSTLAKIERGAIKSPSIFTIQQLAIVLGVGIDEIIGTPKVVPESQAKKRSKNGISFVFFDINGCLVHHHRAFDKITADLNLPLDLVESVVWKYDNAICRGDISLEEFNSILAQSFGVQSFDWSEYYLGSIEPITETRDLLAWAADHYKIGLLSNIMPGLITEMTARDLIPVLDYDVIIDSSQTGHTKPEPEIFDIATKEAGVPSSEILLVDDTRANLMNATEYGWRTLWFDDSRPAESSNNVRKILEF